MNKRPPILLIVVAIAYVGYTSWLTITAFAPAVAIRLALSVLLFTFVLRGSRTAGNILAILSAISALILLYAAIVAFTASPALAAIFVVAAALFAAFSAYLFLSPSVRAFQGRATDAATS